MSLPGYPCTKKRHPTQFQAEAAIVRIWQHSWRWGPGRMPVRAYRCPHCNFWHITSQPLREKVSR